MYKLLIVDDERIIRETIATLIDWEAIGIEVIGAAENGYEAYDIIVDNCPDIVMTDIKMPGYSGVELIEKVRLINDTTQFVILSGYGEFEFAKIAMRQGVKHYLLKPCNESQIIETILEVIDDLENQAIRPSKSSNIIEEKAILFHATMISIVNDYLYTVEPGHDLSKLYKSYEHIINFNRFSFTTIKIFSNNKHDVVDTISRFFESDKSNNSSIVVNNTYCISDFGYLGSNNSGFLFFRHRKENQFENFLLDNLAKHSVTVELIQNFTDLKTFLDYSLPEIRVNDIVYYSNGKNSVAINNLKNFIIDIQNHFNSLLTDTESFENSFANLHKTLSEISDKKNLKQIAISLLLSINSANNYSIINFNIAEFIIEISKATTKNEILSSLKNTVIAISHNNANKEFSNRISSKIKTFVLENIADPRLSLRYIADHVLYMNEDYIGRRFRKETKMRFSHYLTITRVEEAKKILLTSEDATITDIASQVGFGNNPKYFSQIFKKTTGLSPSEFKDSYR